MHGLTLHCADPTSAISAAGTGMTGMSDLDAGADAHEHVHSGASTSANETAATSAGTAGTHAVSRVAAWTPDPAQHGGMCDMVMLCVAMLVAAASALLALLLVRRPPQSFCRIARNVLGSVIPGLVPSRGGTGPPHVWAFAVIRC
jgi:hypothetical protein